MNKFAQQSKKSFGTWLTWLVFLGCLLALTACGGGGGDAGGGPTPTPPPPSPPPPKPVILQAKVTGLTGLDEIVLQNNGADPLVVHADGFYQFSKLIPQKSTYNVSVTSPEGKICTVLNSAGTAGATNLIVDVVCSTIKLTVGGTVKGLIPGSSVTLANNNNSTDVVTVSATDLKQELSFTFKQPVAFNSGYTVTVSGQPFGQPEQVCTVTNSSKKYITESVTDISVICSTQAIAHTISGSITGLTPGKEVTLQNNSDDFTIVAKNGPFSFNQKIANLSGYDVTVKDQPDGLTCTVGNSSGSGVITDISTVNVLCSETIFDVGGVITGLNPTKQVTLSNNGDFVVVKADSDGKFTFKVAKQGSYLVRVAVQPDNQVCSPVANYKQSNVTADVTNIAFICSEQWFTVGGTLKGLLSNSEITVNNNDVEARTLYKDGGFTFQTSPVALGGSFDVTIDTPPFLQNCKVTNGTGTDVRVNVDTVLVTCQPPVFSFLYQFNFNFPYGEFPVAKLIQDSKGTFYGTTSSGGEKFCGITRCGTVFQLTLQGNKVTLVTLSSLDGGNLAPRMPRSELVLGRDGNLYGTTTFGGDYDGGTIFMVDPATGVMTVVYSFGQNNSGTNLTAGLVEDSTEGSAGVFYGTARYGGQNDKGTVFKIIVDPITKKGRLDAAFSHSFNGEDGTEPYSTLRRDTDALGRDLYYGTTRFGGGTLNGAANGGTIFTIRPDGTFASLYSFKGVRNQPSAEGLDPQATLVKGRDGYFYGTTNQGGLGQKGTLFQFNPQNNTVKTVVHFNYAGPNGFPGNSPGSAGLVLGGDGSFYGTTMAADLFSAGQLFRYTPPLTNAPDDMGTIESLYAIIGAGTTYSTLMQGLDGDLYATSQTGGEFGSGTIFKFGMQ